MPLVHTTSGSSIASVTSLNATAISTTTGNLLVVGVRAGSTTATITVTDTANNTFTSVISIDGSGTRLQEFYAKNITGNASNVVTANFSASTGYVALIVHEYSVIDTSAPLDAQASALGIGAGNVTSGSFSTTQASEVSVPFATWYATGLTATAGSGYTLQVTDSNGMMASEDQVFTSIQTGVTASMSWNSGTVYGQIVLATFIASGGTAVWDYSGEFKIARVRRW